VAPQTTLRVTSLGPAGAADAAPSFALQWTASDDLAGVQAVTLYVAENGGDFRIWQRQLGPQTTQALFTGETGKHYEFLAVATDRAGNREAAVLADAVLPDDGTRRELLAGLGVNETLQPSAATPLAANDRSYPTSALFAQAQRQLPGQVASSRSSDLHSVLAPFTLRGFADGYAASAADIGAQALVEMTDGSILASAGVQAQRSLPLRTRRSGTRRAAADAAIHHCDQPIVDLAVDAAGQLWVMTGAELLQVDAASGRILERLQAPGGEPLTQALAIDPQNGQIYLSTGQGIVVYDPAAADPAAAWRHFSKQRVGDLAFAPDGRLWAVRWTGGDLAGAAIDPATEIVSFPMSGRHPGRAELEYRLAGVIDSLAFGADGTPLAGLLLASSQPAQHPVFAGVDATPRQGSVWMIELASRQSLQLASGGTRGEAIVATRDGRILVAQTRRIDEIALRRTPRVAAVTVPDGALVPLPMSRIGVVFDQEMWTASTRDVAVSASSTPRTTRCWRLSAASGTPRQRNIRRAFSGMPTRTRRGSRSPR
jgi:hypothetical protein